jgi:hypothetical protein
MKISDFLRKELLLITGGVILNFSKLKKRRDTLYFGDIPARYFQLCERKGFGPELKEIGRKWMHLYFTTLLPEAFRSIEPSALLNGLIKKVWINMGLMEDFLIEVDGKNVRIATKGEGTTELIGRNSFQTGFYEGILNALYGKEVETSKVTQSPLESSYEFRVTEKSVSVLGKSKKEYDSLNRLSVAKGTSLHEMMKNRVFYLNGKKLYFRNRVIYPIENTVLHLFGNEGILMDEVTGLSRDFFNDILDKDSSEEEKLRLLKNLLQSMGWGIFNIAMEKDSVKFKIENPPYGLQREKDNWEFLTRMISGYMMSVSQDFEASKVSQGHKVLNMGFSR